MKFALGPVQECDCTERDECTGEKPNDIDDIARMFANKLSRCLVADPDGIQRLLLHAVPFETETLAKVGIKRLSGDVGMSLSVLLTSLAGVIPKKGSPAETRLVTLTKTKANKYGFEIIAFAALADARDILARVKKQAKTNAN